MIGAFITSILAPVVIEFQNELPLWISLALSVVGPILFLISCSVIACSKTINVRGNKNITVEARKIVDYSLITVSKQC